MTKPSYDVERRKLAAFRQAGTCAQCARPMVYHSSGRCRRCRPKLHEVAVREASAAFAVAQDMDGAEAGRHFTYWLTVRKKDQDEIGALARSLLADRKLRGARLGTIKRERPETDITLLLRAWALSEADRKQSR